MIRKLILFTVIVFGLMDNNCYADNINDNKENIYLKQILNQLDAIQPLIIAAEKSQPKNQRIQFHYNKYKDDHGVIHNGLIEDIQTIRSGLNQKLNQISVEPRSVVALKGDYQ